MGNARSGTPIARRRIRIRRRWCSATASSTTRTTACSRCGTWAAIRQNTCYATSTDGIEWEQPALDVVAGTNIVIAGNRDSSTVWLDLDERRSVARVTRWRRGTTTTLRAVHLARRHPLDETGHSGPTGDRTTFFYNPFRKRLGLQPARPIGGPVRHRRYWETRDFVGGAQWKKD